MSGLHVVYALLDPRIDRVAYIGKTTNPRSRLNSHLSGTSNPQLGEWIAALEDAGEKPIMQILDYGGERKIALQEQELIRRYDKRFGLLNNKMSITDTSAEDVLPKQEGGYSEAKAKIKEVAEEGLE